MSEDLKLQIAVLIKNVLSLIVFALLAIFFHNWWIVLLNILFITTVKNKEEKNDRR